MFRIVCLVEDKNLHKVLHAVAGLVVNMEPPTPVVNAVIKNGKAVQASTASSKKDMLIEQLKPLRGKQVTTGEMKKMFVALGGGESSVNSTLTGHLMDEKVLKRKERGVFLVL